MVKKLAKSKFFDFLRYYLVPQKRKEEETAQKADAKKAAAQKAEAKKSEHPKAEAKKSEHPKAEAKKSGHPKAEAKKSEHPKAEAKKSEHPKAEAKKSGRPKAEAKKSEHPKAEAKESEHPKAEAKKFEHPKAEAKTNGNKVEMLSMRLNSARKQIILLRKRLNYARKCIIALVSIIVAMILIIISSSIIIIATSSGNITTSSDSENAADTKAAVKSVASKVSETFYATKNAEEEEKAKKIAALKAAKADSDKNLLMELVEAEAGDQSEECKEATFFAILNRIEDANAQDDYEKVIFEENQFEPADPVLKMIKRSDGTIVYPDEISKSTKRIYDEIKSGIRTSPIKDWTFFIGFTAWGYPDGEEFADIYNISEYKVIEDVIFFSEWTEELNNLVRYEEITVFDEAELDEAEVDETEVDETEVDETEVDEAEAYEADETDDED